MSSATRECGVLLLLCGESPRRMHLKKPLPGFRWVQFRASTRVFLAAEQYTDEDPGSIHLHTVWCKDSYTARAAKALIESWFVHRDHAGQDLFLLCDSDLRQIRVLSNFTDVLAASLERGDTPDLTWLVSAACKEETSN